MCLCHRARKLVLRHACPESYIVFMAWCALCGPLIADLFTSRTALAAHSRSRPQMTVLISNATIMAASLFGQAVNAATCSTTVPHYSVPTGNTIHPPGLAARQRNSHAIRAILFLFSPQDLGLAFAATKRCLQSGNHNLLGSPWFVAASVLTQK